MSNDIRYPQGPFTASGDYPTLEWQLWLQNPQVLSILIGTAVPVVSGGTGFTSYTTGDLIYADSSTTMAQLHDVATGNALISGGVGAAPSYGKIGLTTHVSGTLPVANGGTNLTSYTIGDLIYASGATTLSKLADVATGNALISGGVGVAPSWGKINLGSHVTGTLQAAQFPALTGDVTTSAGSLSTTIGAAKVQYSMIQNVTDARLLGRSAGSAGSPMEITAGTGLDLSGGSLTPNLSALDPTNTNNRLQGSPINAQTGTTYTLALGDAGTLVTLTNAAAITLTIPTNASVAFPVGTEIPFITGGAGQVTYSPAGGVTMNSKGGATKSNGQYSEQTLRKTATNAWVLLGDITV